MDLNLRDVNVEMVGKLKAGALRQGVSLKQYCVEALAALAECDVPTPTIKAKREPKPAKVAEDSGVPDEILAAVVESPKVKSVEKPKKRSCGWCGGSLVDWTATMMQCSTCKRNVMK